MNGKQFWTENKQLATVCAVLVSPSAATEQGSVTDSLSKGNLGPQLPSSGLETKDVSTTENSDMRAAALPLKPSRVLQGKSSRRNALGKRTDNSGKEFRVKFRDAAGQGELAQVIEVESYKQYNVFLSSDTTGCTCSLL